MVQLAVVARRKGEKLELDATEATRAQALRAKVAREQARAAPLRRGNGAVQGRSKAAAVQQRV
jgi:hypothetical protein